MAAKSTARVLMEYSVGHTRSSLLSCSTDCLVDLFLPWPLKLRDAGRVLSPSHTPDPGSAGPSTPQHQLCLDPVSRTYPLGLSPALLSCLAFTQHRAWTARPPGTWLPTQAGSQHAILADACHLFTPSQHVQPGHGLQHGIPGPPLRVPVAVPRPHQAPDPSEVCLDSPRVTWRFSPSV